MVVSEVWLGGGGKKACYRIEFGVCKKVKDESEVQGLSKLEEEIENAKIELEVGGCVRRGKQIGGTVETSLVQPYQDKDDYYTSKCTSRVGRGVSEQGTSRGLGERHLVLGIE